jgi:preprotein translocase subunit SecG
VSILGSLLNLLLILSSIFLICLVLIQRGKGGGLAGAFGGVGGSSAFGTKAGDVFTRITIVTAGVWFLLAMLLVIVNNQGRTSAGAGFNDAKAASTKVELPGSPSTTPKAGTTTAPVTTTAPPAAAAPAPAGRNEALPSAIDDTPAAPALGPDAKTAPAPSEPAKPAP